MGERIFYRKNNKENYPLPADSESVSPEKKQLPVDIYGIIKKDALRMDDKEVIDRYFEITKKLEPRYFEEIENISKEIGELSPNVEFSIVIPAYKEGSNIQKCLTELKDNISLKDDQYEVILVINYPEGETPDDTMAIADSFKQSNNWKNLKIINKAFSRELANVGSARKLGSDIALYRYKSLCKEYPPSSFYIAGTDADLVELPKDHYSKMLDKLKQGKFDVIGGRPKTEIDNQLADFLSKRPNLSIYYEFISALRDMEKLETRNAETFFSTPGPDFALTSASYARIGGIPRMALGEDTMVASRTIELGLNHGSLEESPILSSARRYLSSWRENLLSDPYTLGNFLETSKNMRELAKAESPKYIEAMPDISFDEIEDAMKMQIKIIAGKFHVAGAKEQLTPEEASDRAIKFAKDAILKINLKFPIDLDNLKSEIVQYISGNLKTVEIEPSQGTEMYERTRLMLDAIYEKYDNPSDRIIEIMKKVELFSRNIDKKIFPDEKIEEIQKALDACVAIQDKKGFLDEVMKILKSVIDIKETNPNEFEEAEAGVHNEIGNYTKLNRLVTYDKDKSTIHLHHTPGKTVSGKRSLYLDAMKKLAVVVNNDPDIKEIMATSWIVADNPGIFTRFGFRVENASNKFQKDHLTGEEKEQKTAKIDREQFLKRFLG